MTPVNNKSLLHFIFDQMGKLDRKEKTVDEARAMSSLAKQAYNSLNYELERTRTLIKADEHNRQFKTNIEIRNVEGKLFDNEVIA